MRQYYKLLKDLKYLQYNIKLYQHGKIKQWRFPSPFIRIITHMVLFQVMSRQTTLFVNRDSGRVELQKGNSGLTHDLDESDDSEKDMNEEAKEPPNYITTNTIIPAQQKISLIEVHELSTSAIRKSLDDYRLATQSLPGQATLFDPKESLRGFQRHRLPASLLTDQQVKSLAIDTLQLYHQWNQPLQNTMSSTSNSENLIQSATDQINLPQMVNLGNQQSIPFVGQSHGVMPKRLQKQMQKQAMIQENERKQSHQAKSLSMTLKVPQLKIARRLGKSLYWVKKQLGVLKKLKRPNNVKRRRKGRFNKIHERARAAIQNIIKDTKGILLATNVRKALVKDYKIKLSNTLIQRYLKEALGMTFKVMGVVGQKFDDQDTILKRQVAAAEYIRVLKNGAEVFNIDESSIRSTDQRRRSYGNRTNRIIVSKALRLPQISIIAAVSNKGQILFSVNQGSTTSLTFSYFIASLCQKLDQNNKSWRQSSVFLLDNASFHKSQETRQILSDLKVPVMFLGPYSFDMAAVEKLFSVIKNRDLNPLAYRAYSKQVLS